MQQLTLLNAGIHHFLTLVRTLIGCFRMFRSTVSRILLLQPAYVGICFSAYLRHKHHHASSLKNATPEILSASLFWHASPSISHKRVFFMSQGSSCSEHLVVAFREHSGRQEESDRATSLSVPLRCQPLRQASSLAKSDKRVSTNAALQDAGKGLTLEMGETCRGWWWWACGGGGWFHTRFFKGCEVTKGGEIRPLHIFFISNSLDE